MKTIEGPWCSLGILALILMHQFLQGNELDRIFKDFKTNYAQNETSNKLITRE